MTRLPVTSVSAALAAESEWALGVERRGSSHGMLDVTGGQPKYCYNYIGQKLFSVEGRQEIPAGGRQVGMEST